MRKKPVTIIPITVIIAERTKAINPPATVTNKARHLNQPAQHLAPIHQHNAPAQCQPFHPDPPISSQADKSFIRAQ